METQPSLELALRERDRVAYSIRKLLRTFDLRVAFLNPKPACVELHFRSSPSPEFAQALTNFLTAHGYTVTPVAPAGLSANRSFVEHPYKITVCVEYLPEAASVRPILRITGTHNAS
jgi:predicted CoA-binding protein